MFRTILFGLKRIFAAAGIAFMLSAMALAQESLITSVAISKPKDLNGAYRLTIKSDKPIEYKAKAQSPNSIYFDLKNALSVDNIDTIYDNVSGIDGVIVQQLAGNKVRIYVNGENTSNTSLVVKTSQNTGSNEAKQVTINRPIREYRPTTDFSEITEENINWDDNSFNPEHLLSSFFGIFGAKGDLTLVICLVLFALCVVVSKKAFAKVRLQEEPLIGLSSAYKQDIQINEESEFARAAVAHRAPMPQGLHNMQRPQTAYKTPVTTPVHKAPITPKANAVKQNYALGAYQNAQKNPYVTRDLSHNTSSGISYQKRVQKPINSSAQYATRVQKPQQTASAPKQTVSPENIKFLESVTKIYEQSGRKDLAQGLRAGINRKKTAV